MMMEDDCIYSRFQSIHGVDTVPKLKPSPDGLFLYCNAIGIAVENCVYIVDNPSDAVAAKGAGILAIGVLRRSHLKEAVTEIFPNYPISIISQSVIYIFIPALILITKLHLTCISPAHIRNVFGNQALQ